MTAVLDIKNRQRKRRLNLQLLQRICRHLISGILKRPEFELRIVILAAAPMADLNWTHLRHEGPTDVITFDYSDALLPDLVSGEIYVCLPVAEQQARVFRTSWQCELVRYIVHGLLHLLGYDDHAARDRRRMKQAENKIMRNLPHLFPLARLSGPGTTRSSRA